MKRNLASILFCGLLGFFVVATLPAQAQQDPSSNVPQQSQGRGFGGQEGGPRPSFGKITAIHNGSLEITRTDGQTVTIKITDQTEFRKDREKATISDFKVGDLIMIRGDENPDHTVTAKMIGARSGSPGGPGGPGGGPAAMGTLGKDYVAGEVKAIDAPRLTILRTDNVSQIIELSENTSLRKGRDSITMADIQVGDHVMARGALQNDLFVPKGVMVMNAEQWKRMQEMRSANGGSTPPANSAAPQSKPAEPPN
jgi:hypothetical protein